MPTSSFRCQDGWTIKSGYEQYFQKGEEIFDHFKPAYTGKQDQGCQGQQQHQQPPKVGESGAETISGKVRYVIKKCLPMQN